MRIEKLHMQAFPCWCGNVVYSVFQIYKLSSLEVGCASFTCSPTHITDINAAEVGA